MAGWSRRTPLSRGRTPHGGLHAAGQVAPFTAKGAGGIIAEGAERVGAVQASIVRVFLWFASHSLLTVGSQEARVALAGVTIDGLYAFTMTTAGCIGTRSCVAQSQLLFVTSLVIPHARVFGSLDVNLYTVLISLFVVWFTWSPVLSFLCQRLPRPHPDPYVIDFSDSNPVVTR